MKTKTPWHDPIVEEVRKRGEEYAAKFDFDLDRMFDDLRRLQKESGEQVVSFSREGNDSSSHRRSSGRTSSYRSHSSNCTRSSVEASRYLTITGV